MNGNNEEVVRFMTETSLINSDFKGNEASLPLEQDERGIYKDGEGLWNRNGEFNLDTSSIYSMDLSRRQGNM